MNYFLSITGVVIIGAGLAAGFLGHLAVMYAALSAFIACLFAANLDRISEFKASASGVEAKTREVIARAESALSELQLLATTVGELTLSLVKRSGRIGGYSDPEQESIKARVLQVLHNLGIPDKDLPGALEEWHRFIEFDYAHAILGGGTVPGGVDHGVVGQWKELRGGGITRIPTPDEIREFLDKHGLMTRVRREYLEDYEHYRIHKAHRRPEVWQLRDQWGRLERT